MEKNIETAYIGPQQIMEDWDVSRATAYNIIKKMNAQLKKEHPTALIIAGKVNRIWYKEACLQTSEKRRLKKSLRSLNTAMPKKAVIYHFTDKSEKRPVTYRKQLKVLKEYA